MNELNLSIASFKYKFTDTINWAELGLEEPGQGAE